MILWFDANLSPQIARWVEREFGVAAHHLDALHLRLSTDRTIFDAARAAGVDVIVTKDADFVTLISARGPPPAIIWLTSGNTSNATLRTLFERQFKAALVLIEGGEPLVEIG